MKKPLLSIITLIYLMMSTGIAMETHYCMGRKAGVEVYTTADSKCHKCGMEEKGGCCHDEHKLYKMNSEHKNVAASFSYNLVQVPAPVPVFSFTQFIISCPATPAYLKSPPDIPRPDLCISHCIFRI